MKKWKPCLGLTFLAILGKTCLFYYGVEQTISEIGNTVRKDKMGPRFCEDLRKVWKTLSG